MDSASTEWEATAQQQETCCKGEVYCKAESQVPALP